MPDADQLMPGYTTFGVSVLVGKMVARKNKNIDKVEVLKGAE